jgi:hypothetical protein
MADITNFNIGQGETFKIMVEIINESKLSPSSSINLPQDLTDVDIEGAIRESYTSETVAGNFTITKIPPYASGSIFIHLSKEQTLLLDQRKYVYDILMTSGSSARRILEGSLYVRPAATR